MLVSWDASLPQEMDTSVTFSPYFSVFKAAQIKLGDKGFLSKDLPVRDLVEVKSDVHHLFPREFLKKNGLTRGQYNQIANFAIAQTEINIAIGKKEPAKYMAEMIEQCNNGKKKYGNINNLDDLKKNLEMNCVPDGFEKMLFDDYSDFLVKRRKLMAKKIKVYFSRL